MQIKKWLSYFIPIKVYQKTSKINKNLEITWNNGQLVFDSLHTNFSYGSLQKVLRYGLKYIGFDTIQSLQNILVLGVAGGSVIKTLVNEIGCKAAITGVELDPETIVLANQYFGLSKIENLAIVIDDAKIFVEKVVNKYDLIIIDIFEDNHMPAFLFEDQFIKEIYQALSENGIVLFNTIVTHENQATRNLTFEKKCLLQYKKVKILSKIEGHNELFILNK